MLQNPLSMDGNTLRDDPHEVMNQREEAHEAMHQPFFHLTESDSDPKAPSLRISRERGLSIPKSACSTGVVILNLALERLKDGHDRSCILHWNPHHKDLLLLRHKDDGSLEKVEVPSVEMNQLTGGLNDPQVTVGDTDGDWIWELPPEGFHSLGFILPARYQKLLQHDVKYDLAWRGGEILRWAWGSRQENLGLTLKERSPDSTLPKLILPGRSLYFFRASVKDNPWPMRALREKEVGYEKANEEEDEWQTAETERLEALRRPPPPQPVPDEERSPGAPVLRAAFGCAPTLSRAAESVSIPFKIIYDGVFDNEGQIIAGRQIILHSMALNGLGGEVQKRLPGTNEWVNTHADSEDEDDDDYTPCLFRIPPDEGEWIKVNVSTHKDFITLRCGESWDMDWLLTAQLSEPVGTEFRCRWLGAPDAGWWDWGSREDHASTEVHVSWFINSVVKSSDLGDREKLVIPGSISKPFVSVD